MLTSQLATNPVFVSVGSGLSLTSALYLVNRFSTHRSSRQIPKLQNCETTYLYLGLAIYHCLREFRYTAYGGWVFSNSVFNAVLMNIIILNIYIFHIIRKKFRIFKRGRFGGFSYLFCIRYSRCLIVYGNWCHL